MTWLLGGGAALGAVAFVAKRYLRLLQIRIEVSPFAVTEVHPDGTRRTLFWQDAVRLRRRRWPARWEVVAGNGNEHITISRELLRVYRALVLVVEYGGFQPAE